jgi:hypothetical protein
MKLTEKLNTLFEKKDLKGAISQMGISDDDKQLLRDMIDGEKKLSPSDAKKSAKLVKDISSHVKYAVDGIGLQDIRNAI